MLRVYFKGFPYHHAFILCFFLIATDAFGQGREYYEIKTYYLNTDEQVAMVDEYLENAYIPSAHKLGFENIGVFKPIGIDTMTTKKIIVLTSSNSLESLMHLADVLSNDEMHQRMSESYWFAPHDEPAYLRIETTIGHAFKMMPKMQTPSFATPREDQVFELRSYEGAGEKLYRKKVEMFNEGGEVAIFEDLEFNAVFYAEVIAGSRQPNLIYMTSFEDMESRNEHWDAFRAAPAWKELSGKEEYKNTVSHADIYLLFPTEYSDF